MRGSSVLQRPEALKRNIAKILTAFVVGLVTVFGSALVYSNLQQERDLVPAVNSPENSIQEDQQQTMSSTTVVLPEPSARNTVVDEQPAEATLPSHSPKGSGLVNSQPVPQRIPVSKPIVRAASVRPDALPVSNSSSPQRVPYSNAAPQLPSTPIQESRDMPTLVQHIPNIEQPQRAAKLPQFHLESVVPAPLSKPVVIPATTTLAVRLSETLSSDRNQLGDTFRATLASPLVVDGYMLANAGATVLGRIEASHRASLFGGPSKLSVSLTAIDTWNGQRARLETGWREVKGARHRLANTAKMTAGFGEDHSGSGLGAEARTAVLPVGAELTFILTASLTGTGTQQR
ncbi:MAG: hypothetical protein JO028_02400 [Acidobacteriaceae bacterium]|nr:hypothetical protein [Acidobacteriaceae bacterium]